MCQTVRPLTDLQAALDGLLSSPSTFTIKIASRCFYRKPPNETGDISSLDKTTVNSNNAQRPCVLPAVLFCREAQIICSSSRGGPTSSRMKVAPCSLIVQDTELTSSYRVLNKICKNRAEIVQRIVRPQLVHDSEITCYVMLCRTWGGCL